MPLAAARPQSKLTTAEELYEFPADARFELVRGELRPMAPPAGPEHGANTISLSARITIFVENNNLGRCFAAETGFIIARNPDVVLAPDFAFVAADRLVWPPPPGFLAVVPDLILETRSPSDRPGEVAEKVDEWKNAGVKIVWELNLKTRVLTVHEAGKDAMELTKDDILGGGNVLPGFQLDLRALLGEMG